MNGSRSNPTRHGERSSLDALNRTIEGLEARIEGLMAGGRDTRGRGDDRLGRVEMQRYEPPRNIPLRDDPVSEIMQRQRALEAGRDRSVQRRAFPSDRHAAAQQAEAAYGMRERHAPPAAPAPSESAADIAQALVNLRQELKQDISDGLSREMNMLRSEIRGIRQAAETHAPVDDMRDDLQRLAQSINQLGRQSGVSETESLRVEFDELRSVLDGLAREDSVRRMEDRWSGVEEKLTAFDQGRDDELVALAYRLDELKQQINSVSATPAIRDLEGKLHAMAQAVEALGRSVQPDDRRLASRFEGLDARLDEISRAIAASGRGHAAPADTSMMQRLEARIADLASHIDDMARHAAYDNGIGPRIEALAARIEELTSEQAALRLEERIDQLSQMLGQAQVPAMAPDLTGYLTDISRKIDALDHGVVNDALTERLEYLARRIDDMVTLPAPHLADDRFGRLEGRLTAIAERLEETRTAPEGDQEALRGLEAQIAHLSTLISAPPPAPAALPFDFESRMATIEDHMATNDEYILEAARQAAEAVMEAYQRNGAAGGGSGASSDMAAISALADDLRALEDLTRSGEERTARTFEALHETLVQIAGRLERLDAPQEIAPPARREMPAMPKAEMPAMGIRSIRDDEYPFADEDFAGNAERAMTASADVMVEEPERAVSRVAEGSAAMTGDAAAGGPGEAAARQVPAKGSLISSLAKRLVPGRRETPVEAERQQIDPAPSIDPSDELAPEEANQLLEPGSGVPDVRKILERVRASQNAAGSSGEGDRGDFIAAARRAARMAAEEADSLSRVAPEKKTTGKTRGSLFGRHRRPILLAVGAVLLAMMSYPLVNTLVRGDKAPSAAVAERAAMTGQQQASSNSSAPEAASTGQGEASALTGSAATGDPDAAPSQPVVAAPRNGASGDMMAQPAEDGMDGAPLAAATGAEQLTRPADTGAATAGFEPLDTPADGQGEIPAAQNGASNAGTGEPAAMSAAGTQTAAIIVPETLTPASLAKAAGEGDRLALFEIGARYTDGRGVTSDFAQAAKWYGLSADRGFAPAQYRLANLYEKGQGVARDLARAKTLYEEAAAQGNASAMHNLAVLLATGDSADFAKAATWFQMAAELGVRDSQFNLAVLYARGNGVKQDLEESYKWFAIAARDGDQDAAQKRDEVANAMTPEQLSSAKARFDLWKPQPLDEGANSVELPDEWQGTGTKTATVDMEKAIRNIQAILNNNGFDAGTPDGRMGKKTTAAIKAFQKSVGQPETGEIDDQLVTELLKRNKRPG